MTDEQTSEEVTHNTSNRNWFHRTRQKFRDTPDNFRLAGIGAWRGRERGLAVVAGVFLASLVITTVLSYGVGLSQIFFAESLDSEPCSSSKSAAAITGIICCMISTISRCRLI